MHQGWTAASGHLTRVDTGSALDQPLPPQPWALRAQLGRPMGICSSFFLPWTPGREPSISRKRKLLLVGQWAPAQRRPDFYLVFKLTRSVVLTGIFSLFLRTLVMLKPHSVQTTASSRVCPTLPCEERLCLGRSRHLRAPEQLPELVPGHRVAPAAPRPSEGKPTAARHLDGRKLSHRAGQRRKPVKHDPHGACRRAEVRAGWPSGVRAAGTEEHSFSMYSLDWMKTRRRKPALRTPEPHTEPTPRWRTPHSRLSKGRSLSELVLTTAHRPPGK